MKSTTPILPDSIKKITVSGMNGYGHRITVTLYDHLVSIIGKEETEKALLAIRDAT